MQGIKYYKCHYLLSSADKRFFCDFFKEKLGLEKVTEVHLYQDGSSVVLEIEGIEEVIASGNNL